MEKTKISLTVIPKPEPNTMSVIEPGGEFLKEKKPFMQGGGNTDYICGECGWLLLSGIEEGKVKNMVFRCPNCGAYNLI